MLGWLLAAIYANETLASSWIFKGGTCLKKCFFETYRFSEDLDFTLTTEAYLDETFLRSQFEQVSAWLQENAGIVLPTDRFVFDIYHNSRERLSCEARIYYESFFAAGRHNLPKVKFDLTADEVLVMPASRQTVFHAYNDRPAEGIFITCYSYAEVFGEKVRALAERGRPRDLYDVINLFRNDQQPAAAVVRDVLAQKCSYKGISVPTLTEMDAFKESLERNWEPMLAHQLPALPSFEVYWNALPTFFDWLEGEDIVRPSLAVVTESGDVYRPSYGQLGLRARSGSSLEIIRFAAYNRLCVDLDYTDNSGRRSSRTIEPYSLRRAGTGNVLLYAVRSDSGAIRAYKIDQINDASITNQVFTPRYEVELSPNGTTQPVAIQTVGSSNRLGLPRRRTAQPGSSNRRRSSSRVMTGPTYVFRCPICDKTFKRKKNDSKLNPHKTKEGLPCSGRVGYYEDVIY